MMKKLKKSKAGFTLVELIVVIAIIGVLAAVLAPQYVKWVERGRIAADQSTANTLLSEVQVAIVEAGVDGTPITGEHTITISSEGATAKEGYFSTTNLDANPPVTTTLDNIDPNWRDAKVTNKSAKITANGEIVENGADDATTADAKFYIITYSANGASGEWASSPPSSGDTTTP